MKKEEVVKLIKELNVPSTEMRLNTSETLVMMNILNECNDIYLDVSLQKNNLINWLKIRN